MDRQRVERDYEALLPRVLEKLFRDEEIRGRIEPLLNTYTGREAFRVRLGILKASRGEVQEIERLSNLASLDYRDLLVAAEYPLSFGRERLKNRDPDRYDKLIERERREYDEWLLGVLND